MSQIAQQAGPAPYQPPAHPEDPKPGFSPSGTRSRGGTATAPPIPGGPCPARRPPKLSEPAAETSGTPPFFLFFPFSLLPGPGHGAHRRGARRARRQRRRLPWRGARAARRPPSASAGPRPPFKGAGAEPKAGGACRGPAAHEEAGPGRGGEERRERGRPPTAGGCRAAPRGSRAGRRGFGDPPPPPHPIHAGGAPVRLWESSVRTARSWWKVWGGKSDDRASPLLSSLPPSQREAVGLGTACPAPLHGDP